MEEHDHSHTGKGEGFKVFYVPLFITVAILVLEVAGGLYTHSLALLADAGHVASDTAGLLFAMTAAWIAQRPADETRTYGYHRAEVLAALGNAALVFMAIGLILRDAFVRLSAPPMVDAGLMTVVAVIGLVGNLLAAWSLYRYMNESLNVRGAYLHVLSDALGSVGAVVAGLMVRATGRSEWDAVASIFICLIVAWSAFGLLRDSVHILLEGVPSHLELDKVRVALAELQGVSEVHDLHLWSLSSGSESLTAHLVVADGVDRQKVLETGQKMLDDRFGLHHVTLQIESPK